jgi:hypothetical protein
VRDPTHEAPGQLDQFPLASSGEAHDRRIVAGKNRIARLDRGGAIISDLEEVDDCTPVGGHRVDVAHRLSSGCLLYGRSGLTKRLFVLRCFGADGAWPRRPWIEFWLDGDLAFSAV